MTLNSQNCFGSGMISKRPSVRRVRKPLINNLPLVYRRMVLSGPNKVSSVSSMTNQTCHFGIMGGLAPSVGLRAGVRMFRSRRAKNMQQIPTGCVAGLQYMKEHDILSKNPAGSGGIGLTKVLVDRSMGPCNCSGGERVTDGGSTSCLPPKKGANVSLTWKATESGDDTTFIVGYGGCKFTTTWHSYLPPSEHLVIEASVIQKQASDAGCACTGNQLPAQIRFSRASPYLTPKSWRITILLNSVSYDLPELSELPSDGKQRTIHLVPVS